MTNDARIIVGTLVGWDHMTNLILTNSHERIFSTAESVRIVEIGLYIVRGDNVALVGQIDDDLDSRQPWDEIKVDPISAIRL